MFEHLIESTEGLRELIPEVPHNRLSANELLDRLDELLENPHCSLVFLVRGRSGPKRLHGRAPLSHDPAALDGIPGTPRLAFGVVAEESIRERMW